MKHFSLLIAVAALLFLFSGCGDNKTTELKPGYDKAEMTMLLPVMERTYDTSDIGGFKTPEPTKVKRVFRSKVSPLMNRFDVWITDDKKAILSIRGSIIDTAALSFTAAFYVPMVPAIGKIKMSDSKTFEYKVAELPGAGVHLGMLLALGHISDELIDQIKKQYADGIRDFIILGHSQGSGIGFLATSYIRYLQKDGKLPADFRLKTYNIAAPKTGNVQYAYDYEKITMGGWAMSVNNVLDWVPNIGVTLQSAQDFPKISPFINLKGFFTDLNYKPGAKFDDAAQKFLSVVPNAGEELAKVVHEYVYSKVLKAMPGYVEPELLKTTDFERAGLNIPMIPNADYYKLFPNDVKKSQVWENHSVYPYYILVTTN
ncbi:MAG: hypothetical protein PHN88_16025 [Ignavibacteria bacterium]|nr:hypothetical protein [Ignavibacteria bacterium]